LTRADLQTEPARRLFLALWPEEEARRALQAATAHAVRRCGGRPVPAASWHVTLVFLGSVATRRIRELQRIARERAASFAPGTPLSLTFARLVHWKRPQILCALAEESPAVQALAHALQDATAAAGFTPDLKRFHPHVTLARKVLHAGGVGDVRPVVWRFAAFNLIDSRTEPAGPVYSVIDTYSLVEPEKARE